MLLLGTRETVQYGVLMPTRCIIGAFCMRVKPNNTNGHVMAHFKDSTSFEPTGCIT